MRTRLSRMGGHRYYGPRLSRLYPSRLRTSWAVWDGSHRTTPHTLWTHRADAEMMAARLAALDAPDTSRYRPQKPAPPLLSPQEAGLCRDFRVFAAVLRRWTPAQPPLPAAWDALASHAALQQWHRLLRETAPAEWALWYATWRTMVQEALHAAAGRAVAATRVSDTCWRIEAHAQLPFAVLAYIESRARLLTFRRRWYWAILGFAVVVDAHEDALRATGLTAAEATQAASQLYLQTFLAVAPAAAAPRPVPAAMPHRLPRLDTLEALGDA